MTKQAEEYLRNTIGVYCHLKMALNHTSCIKGTHTTQSKHDRYMANKMAKLESEINKTIKPIEKFLKDNNTIEDVEDMIVTMHELVDPVISRE